jgi:hypothetical protein
MSPNSPNTPRDELLERYSQAKAMLPDGLAAAPNAATRERIMHAAQEQAAKNTPNSIANYPYLAGGEGLKSLKFSAPSITNTSEPANDSFWNIKAFASLAVMGLSALLWWQFENGTPDEQQAAKSAQPAAASAPAAAAPTPALSAEPVVTMQANPTRSEKVTAAKSVQPPRAAPTSNITSQPNAKAAAMEIAEGIAPAVPALKPLPQAESLSQPSAVADAAERSQTLPAAPTAPRPTPAAVPVARSTPNKATVQPDAALRQNYEAEAAGQTALAPSSANKEFQIPSASAEAAKSAAPSAQAILLPTEPLFTAIEQRNAATLRQALSQGNPPNLLPNARTREGNPALTQAVIQRWAEGVRILLAAGADRNAKNSKGHTASDVALELGYADMAELLAAPK